MEVFFLELKCVDCNKEAEYVAYGFSFCKAHLDKMIKEAEEKEDEEINDKYDF